MTAAGGPVPPHTAFAINVPEAEACVAELRARYDPLCALGAPAHITILYPFMEPSAIDDASGGRCTASPLPLPTTRDNLFVRRARSVHALADAVQRLAR